MFQDNNCCCPVEIFEQFANVFIVAIMDVLDKATQESVERYF